MTLTEELLSCSRRHRTNAFSAAFEAEYAGSDGAGTMARLDPVLKLSLSMYRLA
jgi:hypothetical protein